MVLFCLQLTAVEKQVGFTKEELKKIKSLAPLPALKADPTNKVHLSEKAALFGENMFGDWRLSRGEEFACQTCHRTTDDWMTVRTDTERDIPSLWNMGHNKWFFWDGRADSLWAQALGPIENPKEHDFSRGEIAQLIFNDPDYRKVYEELFGKIDDLSDPKRFPIPAKPADYDEVSDKNWKSMTPEDQHKVNKVFANVGKALAAFQASIVSQKTRFDQYVADIKTDQPKPSSLTYEEQMGLKVFVGKGKCIECHSGPNFSDGEFHNTQVPTTLGEEYESGRKSGIKSILASEFNSAGRYSDDREYGKKLLKELKAVSEQDRKFKTPTLRNIVNTNPYMRNGQFESLQAVIDFYSEMKGASKLEKGQKREIEPRNFTEQEKKYLLAFLKSLSSHATEKSLSRN